MSNPVYKELHKLTIAQLLEGKAKKELITVKADDNVDHVMKVLSENKVQSAPVMKGKECLGLCDVLDIVAFVASVAPDQKELDADKLRSLEIAGRTIALEAVQNVMDASGRDPFVPVVGSSPVTMAINLFKTGIHRIPVVNEADEVIDIISQSDVVAYLADNVHMGHMRNFGQKTLEKHGLGVPSELLTVPKSKTVLECVNLLGFSAVTALAVVDDKGNLVANVSPKDFGKLVRETLPSLLMPVFDFLNKYSPASLAPIVVRTDLSFSALMHVLTDNHLHHVWSIDSNYKPQGITTLTDVCRTVVDGSEN